MTHNIAIVCIIMMANMIIKSTLFRTSCTCASACILLLNQNFTDISSRHPVEPHIYECFNINFQCVTLS